MNDSAALKKSLRQQAKTLRSEMPMETLASIICESLLSWPVFREAKAVLLYYPFRGELNLMRLMSREPDKDFYLPRVQENGEMRFYRYEPGDTLVQNAYGIPEPDVEAPLWKALEGGLILLPGLMFDFAGYRLGYGKGYYDRFIEKMAAENTHLILAGAVPEGLLVERLPRDDWDRPCHYVITETRILETK